MTGFELNKLLGAVLLAGLIAMFTGFVASKLVEPVKLAKPAYEVAVPEAPAQTGSAAPAGPEPIAPLLASANVGQGEKIAKACSACHTFTKGGAAGVGPNLYNIVGSKHAHQEGYSYSTGLQNLPGTWTYDDLNRWLWSPKSVVPGTKMTFAGLKKTQERADVIDWLRSLSDNPVPLPDANAAPAGGTAAPAKAAPAPAAAPSSG